MSEEIKQLFEEQAKLWESYKKALEKDVSDLREGVKVSAETQEKLDKMDKRFGEIDDSIKTWQEERTKQEEKIKDLEAKTNRPRGNESSTRFERKDFIIPALYEAAIAPDAEKKTAALWKAIRTPGALTPEEKVMTIADPETGGYLATPEFVNDIIKEMREITPVLTIAKVRTTSANSIVIPKKTGTITAARRGESESKSETTGLKYGIEQMTLPELYAFIDVSQQNLEDSMFNLEAEIREEFQDAFAAKIGTEFITGAGPLQLEGLLTNGDIGETKSGSNTVLQTGPLIEFVEAALKQQYKVSAKLMFNMNTLAKIRQLVDSGSHYVWAPGQFGGALVGGAPSTVCGKPYIISEDMPDIAQDAYPIVYGDFKKGYIVGMRIRLGINRLLDSTLDAAGTVRISGRMRIGGSVVLAAAIKKHKIST